MMKFLSRTYLTSAPWVFGQHKLPDGYKQLVHNEISNECIESQKPGFIYAFNSLIDSICEGDLNTLFSCLEPKLYKHVSEGLSSLNKKEIVLRRLNNKKPEIIPLSFQMHAGVVTDRSQNPSTSKVSKMKDFSFLISMTMKMFNPKEQEFFDNVLIHVSPEMKSTMVVVTDIGFVGNSFIGLFKGDEELTKNFRGVDYHVVRFESNMKLDLMRSIGNAGKEVRDKMGLGEWIISDIDNQLDGNPLCSG